MAIQGRKGENWMVMSLPQPFEEGGHVHLVGLVVAGQRVHDDVDADAVGEFALAWVGRHGRIEEAAALVGGTLLALPAVAAPLAPATAAVATAQPGSDLVQTVQYYGRYGYGPRYYGYRRGPAIGAGIAAGVIGGALAAGALAAAATAFSLPITCTALPSRSAALPACLQPV